MSIFICIFLHNYQMPQCTHVAKFSKEDFSGFIQNIAFAIAHIGAEQPRLNMGKRQNESARNNIEFTKRRIMDANMAQESFHFPRINVLVLASTSMVAKAKQLSETALCIMVNH